MNRSSSRKRVVEEVTETTSRRRSTSSSRAKKSTEDATTTKPKRSSSRKSVTPKDESSDEESEKVVKKVTARSRTTKKSAVAKEEGQGSKSPSRSRTKKVESEEEEESDDEPVVKTPVKRNRKSVAAKNEDSDVDEDDKATKSPARKTKSPEKAPKSPIREPKVPKLTTPMLTSKSHLPARRQPTATPPFTLQDLRNEIKDLFVRPLYKTMYFIIRDLTLVSTWFFANLFILKAALYIAINLGTHFQWDTSIVKNIAWIPFEPQSATFSWPQFLAQSPNALVTAPWMQIFTSPVAAIYTISLAAMAWNYVYWMGHFFTGLLIIAHECGHKALFDIVWLGHIFGWVFHSFLFIPYFSWSFTHRNHHTFNKNQAYDEAHIVAHIDDVFPSVARSFGADYHPDVPKAPRKGDFFPSFKGFVKEIHDNLIEFSFIYRVIYFVLYAVIGFPLYLFMNASGRKYPLATLPPNHFDPNSPVFHKGEGFYVILSNIGIILNCTWIYYAYKFTNSLPFIALYYFMPYIHCHFYFVVYTLCHHSSPALPTYSGDKWNYLQGALSTIDRTHGPLIDNLWHYISRTHVVHHIFSDLPFYHSWEATERLKPILGDYYTFTDEDNRWGGALIALWNHIRDGTFIAEDDHPGLVLVAAAHETAKKNNVPLEHPLVERAVLSVLPSALKNDPHKNGRDVEKEVFWQRTLQLDY